MKMHSQWLKYLTALSLTLSSSAYALPSAPAPQGEVRVSQQSAEKLNSMADTVALSGEQPANAAEWLQIVWVQWVQIIIIEQPQQANLQQAEDFGSYGELLARVKNES